MEYTLVLNKQDIQVLFGALGEVPIKVGINVVEKIGQAVKEQDAIAAQAAGVLPVQGE